MYNPNDIIVVENKNPALDREIRFRQCIEKLTGIIIAVTCTIPEEDGRNVIKEMHDVLREVE
jgi:hypothetical protein